jgi:hypothetical protein
MYFMLTNFDSNCCRLFCELQYMAQSQPKDKKKVDLDQELEEYMQRAKVQATAALATKSAETETTPMAAETTPTPIAAETISSDVEDLIIADETDDPMIN